MELQYKKYKWFFTSGKKLVIGGKSAEQNDELLWNLKKTGRNFYVMHTASPGSPFSIILEDMKKVGKKDLGECAIFTGCFSRAWKQGKSKAEVHIFALSQAEKRKGMQIGTWSVKDKIEKKEVELKLALTKQKGVLRAVPLETISKKSKVFVCPGEIDKTKAADEILKKLNDKKLKKEDIVAALPAGGVRIC